MGTDVNPKTGMPRALEKEIEKQNKEVKEQQFISEGITIQNQLQTDEGQRFLKVMYDRILARTLKLIEDDSQCKALLDVLSDLEARMKIAQHFAERIAEKQVTERFKKDQPPYGIS